MTEEGAVSQEQQRRWNGGSNSLGLCEVDSSGNLAFFGSGQDLSTPQYCRWLLVSLDPWWLRFFFFSSSKRPQKKGVSHLLLLVRVTF